MNKKPILSRFYPDSFYETIKAKITDKDAPVEPEPKRIMRNE